MSIFYFQCLILLYKAVLQLSKYLKEEIATCKLFSDCVEDWSLEEGSYFKIYKLDFDPRNRTDFCVHLFLYKYFAFNSKLVYIIIYMCLSIFKT